MGFVTIYIYIYGIVNTYVFSPFFRPYNKTVSVCPCGTVNLYFSVPVSSPDRKHGKTNSFGDVLGTCLQSLGGVVVAFLYSCGSIYLGDMCIEFWRCFGDFLIEFWMYFGNCCIELFLLVYIGVYYFFLLVVHFVRS